MAARRAQRPPVHDTTAEERVERAATQFASGRPMVIAADSGGFRGELVLAAEAVTPASRALLVRHTAGLVFVALPAERCAHLCLSPQTSGTDGRVGGQDQRDAVDAATGIGTGIAATDPARTMWLLANPVTVAGDFVRPGHVIPLATRLRGVLDRSVVAEAPVCRPRQAGGPETGSGDEHAGVALRFRRPHRPVADRGIRRRAIVRRGHGAGVVDHARAKQDAAGPYAAVESTRHGRFTAIGFHDVVDETEHLAVVRGEARDGESAVLSVRPPPSHRASPATADSGGLLLQRRQTLGTP